jgi:hypothetical protein
VLERGLLGNEMNDCCNNCLYFRPRDDDEELAGDGAGKCRRYPPMLIAGIDEDDAEYIAGSWARDTNYFSQPYVIGHEWCGEFKRSNAADKGPA